MTNCLRPVAALVLTGGLAATVVLTGCSGGNGPNKADTGLAIGAIAGGLLGNTVGKGKGKIATTAIGAVIGGIVGSEIGRSLDKIDRQYAQRAEFDALENGQSGKPVEWRNPDSGRYGEVVPSRTFRRGSLDCRQYTNKFYIDGQPQAMRGTACRNPDGTWSNAS